MFAARRTRHASWLLAVALVLSCKDTPTTNQQLTRVPASLDIVAGDEQNGVVGTELTNPLVVRVEDSNGLPIVGQLVNFRVTAGGGSVFAGSGLTNALGVVQDRWTLGTSTADSQRVEARAIDPNTGARIVFATFKATPLPGPAQSVTKTGGDAQTGALGAALTDSLAVRVADSYGNPVPGATVTWAASAGNGAVSPATSQTNAQGIAKTRWTLGARMDVPHSVTATVATLAPATFSVTPTLPSTATIVKVTGDGASATVGTAMAESLAVRVQLADGRVVAGAQVSWNVTSGGGAVAPGSSVTQPDGVTRARLTLGTSAGANVVTVAASGVAPATFSVTGSPDVPASLTKISGDGQTGTVGEVLPAPLIVRVTDQFGNNVPNATVTWTVTAGGGSVANTSVTNSEGRASMQWTLGGSSGTQRVVASIGSPSVEFAATASSSSLASVRVSPDSLRFGSLNSSSRLTARAFDQFGNELSGVTFTWFGPNGAVATVDASGLVTSRGNGSTWIGARSGSLADSTLVTVRQVTYLVHVSPPSAGVVIGDTTRYVGTPVDTVGHRIPDATISWTTSNGTIATVDGTGLVRGVTAGETWVVAQSEGVRDSARVIVLGMLVAERVSAGFHHSCAIADGNRAFCWGTNVLGQLGRGVTDGEVHTPAQVIGNHSFASIDASLQTTCALEGSTPYCWGNMVSPIPGLPRSATPVARSEIAFTQITHGGRHACGLTAAGKAYCWGDNNRGQLGTDTTLSDSIPRAVVGNLTFASISAGGHYTCGLTTAGEAYCWGNNEYGELGVGERNESGERCLDPGSGSYVCLKRPTRVAGGHSFSAISAGSIHTCAIRAGDGAMFCWGLNDYGQLGTGPVVVNCINRFNGRFACEPSPVAVGDGRAYVSVSAGQYQTCAIAIDNSGLCWGRNETAQLGRTTTEQCTDVSGIFTPCGVTPGLVSGGLTFRDIDTGYFHSCGVTVAREIYCWGDNQDGQLGTGTRTQGGVTPRRVGLAQ